MQITRRALAESLDLGTRKWWRLTGREVDPHDAEGWLLAPTNVGSEVADSWLAAGAELLGGSVIVGDHDAGLLADMAVLDGAGFNAAGLHRLVRDFYQHTARYRLEVWSAWSPLFWPAGELISRVWGKRLQQLAVPMRPLDTAYGMDSAVVPIRDPQGVQLAAGWLRTMRATGDYVYSGLYAARRLPGGDRPVLNVSFPLESGNIQANLIPYVDPDAGLRLESPPGPFGAAGTYVVVVDGGHTYAARLPIHETFRVYVDAEGVLRTDHQLRVWHAPAFRLHYKLEPMR